MRDCARQSYRTQARQSALPRIRMRCACADCWICSHAHHSVCVGPAQHVAVSSCKLLLATSVVWQPQRLTSSSRRCSPVLHDDACRALSCNTERKVVHLSSQCWTTCFLCSDGSIPCAALHSTTQVHNRCCSTPYLQALLSSATPGDCEQTGCFWVINCIRCFILFCAGHSAQTPPAVDHSV